MYAGLTNQITELDISVYDDAGTCWETGTNCDPDIGNPMPEDLSKTQAQMYRDLFNGLASRPSVDSVTIWGISDNESWLNENPISRFNHPLLFDRAYEPKAAFFAIADSTYEI